MHSNCLPRAALVDERHGIEGSECARVTGALTRNRASLPRCYSAHNRAIAVDRNRYVARFSFRILQSPGANLIKQTLPRYLLSIVLSPDEAVVAKRLQLLCVSG